jgi:hypothetical protein
MAGGNSLNAIDWRGSWMRGEGVKLRGGIKAWSEDLAWHLEVGGRAARGGRRRREEVTTVNRRGRKMNLTARANLIERREGGGHLRRREPKGKTYFQKYAIDTRAGCAGKVEFGQREERRQRGRLGQTAEWAARSAEPKARKKNFRIQNWISKFIKALEICTRRFRMNFDMRIFPKFF